ncbi:hypothetical protein SmJEL517_g05386 [Synchytrium microbalum]|uniref:Hexosyltransferase n=1 Tax=Synchytrium microbalum TaxID=1806994 RepID=A0A507BZS7_9FUNG|nr:uncharacterized protein SmJEL517_g05386 [Synchytrium microbalum]TPX31246.1 hypothetical protein SmJEL517_g05386 [Synchytrium microbalum]
MVVSPPKFMRRIVITATTLTLAIVALLFLSRSLGRITSDPPPPETASKPQTAFVGIFSTAERYERRSLIRSTYLTLKPPSLDVKFVVGQTSDKEWSTLLALEDLKHNDILVLDTPENMNEGKTYIYFASLGKRYQPHQYMYAAKMDDDIWIHLPNLERLLRIEGANKRNGTYMGRHVTGTGFMAGMGYVLSWDLVDWISQDSYPKEHMSGQEDANLSGWLRDKDKVQNFWSIEEPDRFYDEPDSKEGWAIHNYSNNTIIIHRLKRTDWFLKASRHFLSHLLPPHLQDHHDAT